MGRRQDGGAVLDVHREREDRAPEVLNHTLRGDFFVSYLLHSYAAAPFRRGPFLVLEKTADGHYNVVCVPVAIVCYFYANFRNKRSLKTA